MPAEQEWLTFARWGEQWGTCRSSCFIRPLLIYQYAGDICSITVLGQPLIILNSAKAAFEMLDKKSAIYSDRPVLQMGGELVGWKNTLVLLPYGDRFRRYRKFFHQSIGSFHAMKRFLPLEEREMRRFLQKLIAKPDDLASHIRWTVGSVILKVSHGYDVKEIRDPFVELAERATEQFALATAPGGHLVDVIPALRHLPTWFPGAGFRRRACVWSQTLSQMVDQPFAFVQQQMAAGVAQPSFTSVMLENKNMTQEELFDLKWSAASLYSGAADTTVSALYAFFLAMTMFPHVAKRAQQEIDAVIGTDRLPGFADRERLPFGRLAIWMSATSLISPPSKAVPHRVMQDDVHDGYLIPKGSLVIPNVWKITHDPRTYRDPMVFNPDRFLSSETRAAEPDPRDICFGFGRRTCPGAHLADTTLFIMCATTLAVVDISKRIENGVIVEPVHENTTGTISHPKPFKCSIRPRSEKAVFLIQSEDVN
ncbi:cytochrome P450 [Coprinopsis cinerea okayama7|uniref:Cytochrome P450 n=1 Tax=Coprinopsis cinerea (strain Okayama-7 / 130 / ATCC MYA-4618 / FGSC 9003) TaxID=240176 RepID=A8NYC0_COPC7|nr:cytochrome P450 [Coprinopsis cinerea okayama7\|eukprot:XP_001837390.1 cytochrome P450 [Coprinopsis cinerea okayama7\